MGKKFIEIIKKKWLQSIALTILLFAIIICAFWAISYGIKKANITDLDFTKDKIYSISQATKDKLGNLDQEITISIYNMYDYVNDFAYKYANLNKNIKVEKLDNLTDKTSWKTEFGVSDASSFIMIESKSKSKLLQESDLYTYDYTTYEQIDVTEEAITNAILDVTTNVKPKICFLTGHNLYNDGYFEYLESSLTAEANEVEFINLLTKGSVPEDCKLLVITALKEDIDQKERDEILKYIKNGGEILLLLDSNLGNIKTPNFQKVLEEYGIKNSNGFIIEGDSNKMVSGAPVYIIESINTNSELVKNVNMELNVCMMTSGKLTFASSEELEKKNVTMETLATASDKAFYRTDLTSSSSNRISSDEDASGATVAAMLTKKINDDKTSKLIVFANTAFATNAQIPMGTYYRYAIEFCNNKDVLLNAVSYLTEREDNITIRKSGETVTTYDVTTSQLRTILVIIIGIPIFIVILGIVIWQVRRRKK